MIPGSHIWSLLRGRWSAGDLLDALLDDVMPPGQSNANAMDWLIANAPNGVIDSRNVRKRKRSIRRGWRDWADIQGETLHQTATTGTIGTKGWLGIPVHGGVGRAAEIRLLWDPPAILWHGHALNRSSIGIEVDCRAAGTEGDDRTVWISKKERAAGKTAADVVREATTQQLLATQVLVEYYRRLVRENGGELEYMWAHRHGHKSRTSDPGSRIWSHVAAPLIKSGEMNEGPVMGSGRPLPMGWSDV